MTWQYRVLIASTAVVLTLLVVVAGLAGLTGRDSVDGARIDWVVADPASTTMDVTYTAGYGHGCADPVDVQVSETATSVRLKARTRTRMSPFRATVCPAVGVSARYTVRLSRPLRNRSVVDRTAAAEGQAAEVENRFGEPPPES